MQIKAGFKKEWLQFTRTFRLGGVLLGILSFSVADPLLYWAMSLMMDAVMSGAVAANPMDAMGELGMILGRADVVFGGCMAEFCSTSTLIIMLILMSTAGGERKKRATIIPSCTGLEFFNYLIPKYVLYPATVFITTFVGCLVSGGICNLIFEENRVGFGMILLAAVMCSVYMAFFTAVYISIGLCSGRPGVVTVIMYVGVSIVQSILVSLDLTKYHPFTLRALVSGEMFNDNFVLADNIGSIVVGIVLSVVIAVMMFILTLTVLKGTKINNQIDKPEF